MTRISPRNHAVNPNNQVECQQALRAAFFELVQRGLLAGWSECATAVALANLAEDHMIVTGESVLREPLIETRELIH